MGHYYTPKNFKEFALYSAAMAGAVGVFALGGAVVSVAIDYHTCKKIGSEISKRTGMDIRLLDELYLYNDDEGYKVVARCSSKSDEIILLEYNVSMVDYIKMNDDDTTKLDYFRENIVPNYVPKIISEIPSKTSAVDKKSSDDNVKI